MTRRALLTLSITAALSLLLSGCLSANPGSLLYACETDADCAEGFICSFDSDPPVCVTGGSGEQDTSVATDTSDPGDVAVDDTAADTDPGDTITADTDPGDTITADTDPGDTITADTDPGDTIAADTFPDSGDITASDALSCLDHRSQGADLDGDYLISTTEGDVTVFCDMTTDAGGWTRVFSYETFAASAATPVLSTSESVAFADAQAQVGGLDGAGLARFLSWVGGTQIRFTCTKGEAVLDLASVSGDSDILSYFTGASDILPNSVDTVRSMSFDSGSQLASDPSAWGMGGTGVWGDASSPSSARHVQNAFYIEGVAYWNITGSVNDCDDHLSGNNEGIWEVWVR